MNAETPCSTSPDRRVAILVNTACVFDSRAIKEAETLAADGFHVRVVCRLDGGEPLAETVNGVEYERHPRRRPLAFLRHVFRRRNRLGGSGNGAGAGTAATEPAALRWVHPLLRLLKRAFGRHLSEIYVHWEFAEVVREPVATFAPSVIHACDLVALPAAAAAARRLGARVVYDVRDLAVEEYPHHSLGIKLWRRFQEWRLICGADRVVVPNEGFADYLRDRYGIGRPEIVYNAPDDSAAGAHNGGLRKRLGFSAEVPLIAFTGALRFDRGMAEIFQALVRCPEFHFARVGPGDEALDGAARELAAELGITDRVHLVPPVRPHEVPAFIADADLTVIANHNLSPNIDLAMPNKIFETALAGLPVALGNYRDMRRFVEENGIGLVMDETDPEDIARAITEVYRQRDRLAPDDAKRRALVARYGWPVQGRRLSALYRDLFPAASA